MHKVFEAVLFKLLHEVCSRVGAHLSKFDPIQEIGLKVGAGCSFVSGRSLVRLLAL